MGFGSALKALCAPWDRPEEVASCGSLRPPGPRGLLLRVLSFGAHCCCSSAPSKVYSCYCHTTAGGGNVLTLIQGLQQTLQLLRAPDAPAAPSRN